ncbi:hypothetical protein CDL15_Pgr027175 [Punica granatum]|uniref:Uncharacterized protein n=1 Tax=Punica granatum TaxID=22663 RepID=A0A218XAJ0_PUNGR|nr:hypothetical protein CDL15_Pgr027175 [Punica granatum]
MVLTQSQAQSTQNCPSTGGSAHNPSAQLSLGDSDKPPHADHQVLGNDGPPHLQSADNSPSAPLNRDSQAKIELLEALAPETRDRVWATIL